MLYWYQRGFPMLYWYQRFPHAILVSKKNAEYLLTFPGTSVFTLFAQK
jgi:hypothetical protein